ncbi:MAG TPA: iron ABC transporter substrate-binding protein [Dehalococcoidia bacterium]|nr:iron ABC transporter substrate-binding protein [Dehalococcoidia bacterium]
MKKGLLLTSPLSLALLFLSFACTGDSQTLTIYSGRSESLVGPLLNDFTKQTGIKIRVRYGDTTELASTILEEGKNSPADIFYAQDVASLDALAKANRLTKLSNDILNLVSEPYRSPQGQWLGTSGRARVVAYNTAKINPDQLPASILEYTDPKWRGRVGWAPTNASFQSFVTALRLLKGEDAARSWLLGMKANNPKEYPNNVTALQAVANGEVDVAFVNHYYLFRALKEQGSGFKARNYYFRDGDPGGLVFVSGAAILDTADNRGEAEAFLKFLLSTQAQKYFSDQTFEYPMIEGVPTNPELPPLSQLEPPAIDLSQLTDLQGTLKLLRETGILP